MLWLWSVLLLIALLVCWSLNLIGLPGNWINLVLAALYAWLMPAHRADFGWIVLLLLAALAMLGELIEFIASAAGVSQVGGTRRGAVLALVGSLIGGVAGVFLGLPIPIVGSLLAALLFSSVGALLGAMLGESWAGRDLRKSWRVGHGAFWGRLFGTLGKVIAGSVMIVVVAVAVIV